MASPQVRPEPNQPYHPLEPERKLEALARARAPLRRVLLALAGRLVATRGWERLGYARPGDYARERLGLSTRALQEFARVDGQLAGLPRLEVALLSGLLSFSKVRLLARFVTAENEAHWIERALGVSVRILEKQVRAVDRGALESGGLEVDEEGGDARPNAWVRIRMPLALCFKWARTREYAAKVAGKKIAPSEALEMITAEVLSALPVELVAESAGSCDEEPGSDPSVAPLEAIRDASDASQDASGEERDRSAELPAFLQSLVRDLATADPHELDARLRRVVRLEQRLDAEISPLLRHVADAEHVWRGQYRTLAAYARDGLGMSPRKARALVRIERVGDVCPALREAYRDGALSWVQTQRLAPLLLWPADGDWRDTWVAFAMRVSVRRLEEVVDRALLWREARREVWEMHCEHPERIAELLDAQRADGDSDDEDADERQTCARPTDSETLPQVREVQWNRLTLSAPREVARLFKAVLCTIRRAMERETGHRASEADAFEEMIDHALASWQVDDRWLRSSLRRSMGRKYLVFERDGWRCTVPGCTSQRNLQAHHIQFRSAGGSDALANQTTLCAFHHLRGVHAGFVRIRGQAPQALVFELGTRAGRPPLVRYESGDKLAESAPYGL